MTNFLYRLAPFKNKSPFGDLLIPSPPLVTQVHSCCLMLGLCSRAVFQLRDSQAPAAQTPCSAMPD